MIEINDLFPISTLCYISCIKSINDDSKWSRRLVL
jgi:hypothetical protein